jgi:hypothetical protein
MAFHFARSAGFAHAAGQNVLVTLLDPPQTDSQAIAGLSRSPRRRMSPS